MLGQSARPGEGSKRQEHEISITHAIFTVSHLALIHTRGVLHNVTWTSSTTCEIVKQTIMYESFIRFEDNLMED